MNLDKDLERVQAVRDLCSCAKEAQHELMEYSQEQVDHIIAAMAEAGYKASERLAQLAVQETGYGNVPDKIKKNQFCTRDLYNSIRTLKTVGVIQEDRTNNILKIAEPMGVVAAIIPTTNPTSTTMFKSIISLKTRNGIVVSPHPRAVRCIQEAAKVVHDAAVAAGAPAGIIGVIAQPTLQATQELMRNPDTDVILATGGAGLVKAAYSAGKPAYGVGPGNVPVYLDRSANYKKAVTDVVAGKSFDYGTLCSSEQALIVDEAIKEQVVAELLHQGAHFMSSDEMLMLEKILLTPDFRVNPEMVGKSPGILAQKAGFSIGPDTRILIAELAGVGKSYPLSAEKLSPTMVFYTVSGIEEGIKRSVEILNFGGRGHTAAIHAKNDRAIRKFGLGVPAFRVVVNSPASLGAVGYTNALTPTMTLGCGSYGRNITSDNISAHHLMNIKRVAYETRPLAAPRNSTTWRPAERSDAPYTKALSATVSRKGDGIQRRQQEDAEPQKSHTAKVYGSTGMTESEVERVIEEFVRNRTAYLSL